MAVGVPPAPPPLTGLTPPSQLQHTYFLTTDDGSSPVSPDGGASDRTEKRGTENPRRMMPDAELPLPSSLISKIRGACYNLVHDTLFQKISILLIVMNAIMVGIGTFNFVTNNRHVEQVFEFVDTIFLILFTIEILIQFTARGIRIFLDGWLTMDFWIIFANWIFVVFTKEESFNSFRVLRAFRMLLVLRLISRVGVLKKVVETFLGIMPRMGAIGALLLLVFYIFAVMFTSLFKHMYEEGLTSDDYFSRIDTTFFTLFQIMTMDGWSIISREVTETYWWAWVLFVAFVSISAFILVNVAIAVIFSATIERNRANHHVMSALSLEWGGRTKSVLSHIDVPLTRSGPSSPRRALNQVLEEPEAQSSVSPCRTCTTHLLSMQYQIDSLSKQVNAVLGSLEKTQHSIEDLTLQLQTIRSTASATVEKPTEKS